MNNRKARNNSGINYFGEVTINTFRNKQLRASTCLHNSSTENLFEVLYNYLVSGRAGSSDALIPKYLQIVSSSGVKKLVKPIYRASSSVSVVDGEKSALLVFSFTKTAFTETPEGDYTFKLQNSNGVDLARVDVTDYSLGDDETHVVEWRLHFADGGTEDSSGAIAEVAALVEVEKQ